MGDIESFGASDLPCNEAALEHVADLIQQVQPGSMVQRFVLLVETVAEDDRYISGFTAPGQKQWDSLGLLEYGLALERNSVGIVIGPDDDSDTDDD